MTHLFHLLGILTDLCLYIITLYQDKNMSVEQPYRLHGHGFD